MSDIRFLAKGLGAALLVLLVTAPAALAGPKTTHLLAMGACPPWKVIEDDPKVTKLMADSCQVDVDTIVAAMRKSLAVADANVTTRLNKDADFAGVSDAITALAGRAKADDRVVIYMNFHGGNIAASYNGFAIDDEVLATYTAAEPEDFAAATANREWMAMKTLRDLVDQIKAEEVIVIFEVCEVGGGFKDFRYDLARRYMDGWKGREAIIFSSRGDQAATYNEAGTTGLFTETFSKLLTTMSSGNLRDIFETAAMETHRSRRATCMKDDNLDTLFDDRATFLDACTQMPTAFDPYGLLDDIQIGGLTAPSRWHDLKDRKPPVKTAKSDASDKAAKSGTAPADKSAADEDPFAWTRSIIGPQSYGYGVVGTPVIVKPY